MTDTGRYDFDAEELADTEKMLTAMSKDDHKLDEIRICLDCWHLVTEHKWYAQDEEWANEEHWECRHEGCSCEVDWSNHVFKELPDEAKAQLLAWRDTAIRRELEMLTDEQENSQDWERAHPGYSVEMIEASKVHERIRALTTKDTDEEV